MKSRSFYVFRNHDRHGELRLLLCVIQLYFRWMLYRGLVPCILGVMNQELLLSLA